MSIMRFHGKIMRFHGKVIKRDRVFTGCYEELLRNVYVVRAACSPSSLNTADSHSPHRQKPRRRHPRLPSFKELPVGSNWNCLAE